jgi:serine/threonine protein kinase
VIKSYASQVECFTLPQIHHRNIIDIYEIYIFENTMFVISEYLDFSLEDLLRYDIHMTEDEIVCVISQVRQRLSFV